MQKYNSTTLCCKNVMKDYTFNSSVSNMIRNLSWDMTLEHKCNTPQLSLFYKFSIELKLFLGLWIIFNLIYSTFYISHQNMDLTVTNFTLFSDKNACKDSQLYFPYGTIFQLKLYHTNHLCHFKLPLSK